MIPQINEPIYNYAKGVDDASHGADSVRRASLFETATHFVDH